MGTKHVHLILTLAEANALAYAAGNSLDDPQDARTLFANPTSLAAAYRAARKLDAARRALLHPSPA